MKTPATEANSSLSAAPSGTRTTRMPRHSGKPKCQTDGTWPKLHAARSQVAAARGNTCGHDPLTNGHHTCNTLNNFSLIMMQTGVDLCPAAALCVLQTASRTLGCWADMCFATVPSFAMCCEDDESVLQTEDRSGKY